MEKAHGWSTGGSPCCCDNTASTPVAEASTSTMKGDAGSGYTRVGAEQKASWSCWKAFEARGFQDRDLGQFFRREVSGELIEL